MFPGQRAQGKMEGGKQKGKKDIPMEMERVETRIPVEYCKLNNRHVWVRKGIGHCSVNGGVECIVAHSKFGEHGRGRCGHLVGDIIERSSVGSIIVCLCKFKRWVKFSLG